MNLIFSSDYRVSERVNLRVNCIYTQCIRGKTFTGLRRKSVNQIADLSG